MVILVSPKLAAWSRSHGAFVEQRTVISIVLEWSFSKGSSWPSVDVSAKYVDIARRAPPAEAHIRLLAIVAEVGILGVALDLRSWTGLDGLDTD